MGVWPGLSEAHHHTTTPPPHHHTIPQVRTEEKSD